MALPVEVNDWAARGRWARLATLVLVIRESVDHTSGKVTEEVRYVLSSLPARGRRLARVVRQPWGIENGPPRV